MHVKLISYIHNKSSIDFIFHNGKMRIQPVCNQIFRCIYTREELADGESLIIHKQPYQEMDIQVTENEKCVLVATEKLAVSIVKDTGIMTWSNPRTGVVYLQEAGKSLTKTQVMKYTTGDKALIMKRVKTVDGERSFIENLKPVADGYAYRGKLHFNWQENEGIYGLGQAEEGIYNYRGNNQYLYQHNMRIPIPVIVSSNCYGILFDCCSLMTFNDDANGSYVFMDTIDQMDYYFMAGDKLDDIVDGYRYLTGKATMLPKWAFGYVQSKEQYYTAEELTEVAQRYRELEIPIDCVVQDWNTWEPGNWGEKLVDKKRYANLKECTDKLRALNMHSMVSIWPNMNVGGKNHTEFLDAGYLLNDFSTYNAFNEDAREMYWKQAKEELFNGGIDSWWCDSTEPFTGPDWNGEEKREPWERYMLVGKEHKKYLPPRQANAYALMHAKGIFENQRKETLDIRVLNLTRSGYASGQRYGAMLWSGDTCASWETMKKQIVEGLNMSISGYPYWTLDIGGFFTVGEKWMNRGCGCNNDSSPKWFWQGRYDEGVKDAGYRELYVRWLQMGAFLPMFRSHGTDTPREIWNFGEKGDLFYDTIEKYIKLRYHLMPYIYSLAGAVRLKNSTLMRSLLFDFLEDKQAREIKDEYMFGPSLLVCPVTEPFYYEAKNKKLEKEKIRNCYLPAGCDWYDYWSGERFAGGQWISREAPLDIMPLFIKAGAVIPVTDGLQYANQKPEKPLDIHIYSGADSTFTLYEDEGNNYNFENGAYSIIRFIWAEQHKRLIITKRKGEFKGMEHTREFRIIQGDKVVDITYLGEETEISLDNQRD